MDHIALSCRLPGLLHRFLEAFLVANKDVSLHVSSHVSPRFAVRMYPVRENGDAYSEAGML